MSQPVTPVRTRRRLAIPRPTTGHTSERMQAAEAGKDQVRTGAPPGT